MPKYAKDPQLNEMARKLKTLTWVNPLDPITREIALKQALDPGARRRLVSPLPDFRHWSVRMYLGGSVRTLGIVIHEDVPAALRFADMAQEYFWKYRVRGANPPADRDLNYDRKQLEQDMAHEAHALALLKEMEEYFLTEGILKSSKERHAEELTKRAQRLNVRTEIKLNHTEIIESLGGLHETCESLVKRLKAIEDQNRILVDIVKTLVSVHTQAVAVPYVPPGYTEVTTNPMITS